MSKPENKQISTLININKDASEFYYESADELAQSTHMRTTFKNLGDLHKAIMLNLETFVVTNGDPKIEADETLVGEVSKFWGKLKARISNDTDEALVAQLEEAEDRCLHSIEKVMKSDEITPRAKAVLQREHTALRKSHDYMKDLKDLMKAA